MEDGRLLQHPRTLPHFISSEQFVLMLRTLRAAAPTLITLELIEAFEIKSSTAFSVAIIGGSVYIIGSAIHFATLTEENKKTFLRKAFSFADNFLHANWMSLRLVSSIAVTGIVLATKSMGPIIVPDWVIIPLEIPAVAIAIGYAITQALNIKNKATAVLDSVLVAAQLSRLLNMPTDILATAGKDVTYLYRTATIIASSGTAVLLKLLESGRPNLEVAQKVIQYASWMTYPVSVVLDNIQLKSIVWPVPTYLSQGIAATGVATAGVVLAKKYYDSTKSEEEVALVSSPKKSELGCFSRLRNCWASWWSPAASTDSSNSRSAQTGQSAETYQNSGSLSSALVTPMN